MLVRATGSEAHLPQQRKAVYVNAFHTAMHMQWRKLAQLIWASCACFTLLSMLSVLARDCGPAFTAGA